ncbi:MAG TPA: NrtA/SsuA/CpmA family ABC transporter substrate-binding protein [Dissulfurispiraceae bacterium]|nr:NrtA/SsuA/CpmA family ABC transporter substrate-binding protein [Dissulfurispiraceae bacterium]
MKCTLLKAVSALASIALVAFMPACSRTDPKAPAPSDQVTIASTILPDSALVQVANAKGYYAAEGLAATLQTHQIGKQALQSVLDGKADFATVAEAPVLLSIMKGEKICIIATIDTSHRNMAILARKDRGIKTLEDLKGRKIATTPRTIADFFLYSILTINGVSQRSVTTVNLAPEKVLEALLSGDVDAATLWNPLLVHAQKKLGEAGTTFYGEDLYTQFFVVVARQVTIRDNPDKVRKVLRALIKAEEFIRSNPVEAQGIVAEYSNTEKALVSETWAANNFRVSLDQTLVLALEDESRWAINNGLTRATEMPNYLDFIYFDGLKSVNPDAVRILR